METARRQAAGLHARLTILLVGIAGAMALLGFVPTRRFGGEEAIQAMWAALGVTVVTSSLAALPVTVARIRPRRENLINVLLGSLVLRMALVVLLGAATVLSGVFAVKPLLLWIGISYLVLLRVDTLYAARYARSF